MTHPGRPDRRSLLIGAAATTSALAMVRDGVAQPATSRGQRAMEAAEELSVLETQEHLPALYTFYDRMHPDAQEIVPRHVVIGWYQEHWQPMGPHVATATGIRFLDWTWPVNDVTYSDIAEVSYIQTFDHAPRIDDVVRLAEMDGEWLWFFGRDRAWVDEQIAHYNDEAYIDQEGDVPYGLASVIGADTEIIASLPVQIGGAQAEIISDARQLPDYAARVPTAVQYRQAEFPVGYAMSTTLRANVTVPEIIDEIVWERIQSPPFELLTWNLEPESGVPFARYEHHGSDAVGNVQTIQFGGQDDSVLWTLSFNDTAHLVVLARALAAMAHQ